MEAQAKLRHLRMGPRKVRLVADLVKGKPVQVAIDNLRYMSRAAARPIYKLIRSAVSNADQKGGIDVDTLYVKTITVDQGPTMKRWMPRARGRADRILKRTSHITVILDEK
jgi:large subunit ribosomal protein L22